jgi:[ribosomal protein S18]-alanine N-acetyltransferase
LTAKGPIRIEPAAIASVDLLATLHGQIFISEEQVWTSNSFTDLLTMPGARAWLAITSQDGQDTPAGFALVLFVAAESEIITIGVLPQHQRQGVAQALLATILDQSHRAGADILLEVAANNEAALKLYLKNEFVEAGRRKNYYKRQNGDRIDALILRRPTSTI